MTTDARIVDGSACGPGSAEYFGSADELRIFYRPIYFMSLPFCGELKILISFTLLQRGKIVKVLLERVLEGIK